jgi:thioredoxin 2
VRVDLSQEPVVLLTFGMEGCDACEQWIPVFHAARARHPGIPAYAINCEVRPEAADAFRVTVTPTTVLLYRGEIYRRFEGSGSAQTADKLFRMAEDLRAQEVGAALASPWGFRRR